MTSPARAALLLAVVSVIGLGLSACGSAAQPPSAPVTALPPRPTIAPGLLPSKVLVVLEENHTETSALQQMSYLAALADAYGQTTNYQAVAHPSLPNYLAIAGGSTFGISDDNGPSRHPTAGPSVFDQAIAAGRSAKIYAEAMPAPCALQADGRYAVKHNAWAYFADTGARSNCQRFDVPAGTSDSGALRSDVDAGALPTVGELIPDLCNDGHDCSWRTADDWLRQWLPVVMAGPDYRSGNLTVVVTFDEDDNSGPNTVLTTVLAPTVNHVRSAERLTHYSLSRYLSEVSGTQPLRAATSAPALGPAFGI